VQVFNNKGLFVFFISFYITYGSLKSFFWLNDLIKKCCWNIWPFSHIQTG